MDVYEAVESHRKVRAFSAQPAPQQVLSRVLKTAGRLLLRAEGLHTCPQVMWTMCRRTVSEVVGVHGLMLLCGVAIGYEDEAVPRLRTGRADLEETVTYLGL